MTATQRLLGPILAMLGLALTLAAVTLPLAAMPQALLAAARSPRSWPSTGGVVARPRWCF